jgi:hypothetical protein
MGCTSARVMRTPWGSPVKIMGLSYDPNHRRNIASVCFQEDTGRYHKDDIGYFPLDDLRPITELVATPTGDG